MNFTIIFSIFAVIIVTSSSMFIVKNKSTLTKLNTSIKDYGNTVETNQNKHNRQIKHLVDQINYNNKSLDKSTNKMINNVHKIDNESKNRISNMNNRLSSFKNISSANFMGLNNRLKKEHEKINENHKLLQTRHNEDVHELNQDITTNLSTIENNHNKFNDYSTKNDNKIDEIYKKNESQDNIMQQNYFNLNEAIGMNASKAAEELGEESRNIVRELTVSTNNKFDIAKNELDLYKTETVPNNYVNKNGTHLDDSLNNRFFQTTNLMYNKQIIDNNMNSFTDLINLTELNRQSNASDHKTLIDQGDKLTRLEALKLDKAAFNDTFENTNYHKSITSNTNRIEQLDKNIGANFDNIAEINSNINLMKSVRNNKFGEFTAAIENNAKNISTNLSINQQHMKDEFGKYQTQITDGLTTSNIINKLDTSDLKVNKLTANTIKINSDATDAFKINNDSVPGAWKEMKENYGKLTTQVNSLYNYSDRGTYMFEVLNPVNFNTRTKFSQQTDFYGNTDFQNRAVFNNNIEMKNNSKIKVNDFDDIMKSGDEKLSVYIKKQASDATISRDALETLIGKDSPMDMNNIKMKADSSGPAIIDNGTEKNISEFVTDRIEQWAQVDNYVNTGPHKQLQKNILGYNTFRDGFDTLMRDDTTISGMSSDISINNVAISSINNRIDNPDLVTNILSNPNDVGIIDVYSTRNTTPSSLSINVGVKSVQIQGHKKETSVDNTGIRLIVDGVESDQIIDFPTQVVEDTNSIKNKLKDQFGDIDFKSEHIRANNISIVEPKIKLGSHCLKVTDGVLTLCDTNCDNCTNLWDEKRAPHPEQQST